MVGVAEQKNMPAEGVAAIVAEDARMFKGTAGGGSVSFVVEFA